MGQAHVLEMGDTFFFLFENFCRISEWHLLVQNQAGKYASDEENIVKKMSVHGRRGLRGMESHR